MFGVNVFSCVVIVLIFMDVLPPSIQQPTIKDNVCFDNHQRCTSKQECAYTFVFPRPNGEQCQSVEDTVVEMTKLRTENENLKQQTLTLESQVEDLKQENEDMKQKINTLLEETSDNSTVSKIILSRDGCLSMPCFYGGTCVDHEGGFTCLCPDGHTGGRCEAKPGQEPCLYGDICSSCIPATYSRRGVLFCCPNCGSGIWMEDSVSNIYICKCDNEDADECLSSPCQNGGTCQDVINGFICDCVYGFTGTFCQSRSDAEPICGNDTYHDPCNDLGTCPYEHTLGQKCINGECICELPEYSTCSCLPSVGECTIERRDNLPDSISVPVGDYDGYFYICRGVNNAFNVHVIAYGGSPTNVIVRGSGNGNPIILVFVSSYYPIYLDIIFSREDVIIENIILVYPGFDWYSDRGGINAPKSQIKSFEGIYRFIYGFGDDRGGYYTVGLLKYLQRRYGPITSFTGVSWYTGEWVLALDAS